MCKRRFSPKNFHCKVAHPIYLHFRSLLFCSATHTAHSQTAKRFDEYNNKGCQKICEFVTQNDNRARVAMTLIDAPFISNNPQHW